ncbi:hypothetical protein BDZ91DRAFT_722676 [Kalaharituber pfeilii]|nr:hypothetical protein BDZ91DRAFT_722676 [Kalaharituber pfeilii]
MTTEQFFIHKSFVSLISSNKKPILHEMLNSLPSYLIMCQNSPVVINVYTLPVPFLTLASLIDSVNPILSCIQSLFFLLLSWEHTFLQERNLVDYDKFFLPILNMRWSRIWLVVAYNKFLMLTSLELGSCTIGYPSDFEYLESYLYTSSLVSLKLVSEPWLYLVCPSIKLKWDHVLHKRVNLESLCLLIGHDGI